MSPSSSSVLLLLVQVQVLVQVLAQVLVFLLQVPGVQSFEAPVERRDVFAEEACPAFLTFRNAPFLSGVTAELPCLCKPPQVNSVVWFYRERGGGAKDTRALTDHRGNRLLDSHEVSHSADLQSRFSIRLFSLLLFRVGVADSGLYLCGSAHGDFFFGYDVDVQQARTLRLVASPRGVARRNPGGVGLPLPRPHTFTSFGRWRVCDRCGPPGEQLRIGLCYVHSRLLHVRYRRANQTVASCGSGAVPKSLRRRMPSSNGARLEVRPCHVTCPSQAPPPSGLLLFLGFSSSSPAAEQLSVFYLSHPAGGVLTLECPGARPNMAVAWDRGSRPIYRFPPSPTAAAPRLTVDAGNHLLFQPAQTEDSGSYFCWLKGRRAVELRLLVYPGLGPSQTSHSDIRAGVVTVATGYSVMTAVFCLLLIGRLLLRHHRDAARE